uniref:CUB domain-containing protein n=1 Tax=Panagrolaimus sp. JU765 TaxID=591449 RepID=A0AC34R1B6_9BILA
MEISVKPSEQIALNSNGGGPEKGTCKWNVTEDGKLPVDVTVTTGFDVRVEGAELYQDVNNAGSGVSIWVYVGGIVGAMIVCMLIGGIFYYFHTKKEAKLQNVKKGEKEIVQNVVTTPKPVEPKTCEVNVVG